MRRGKEIRGGRLGSEVERGVGRRGLKERLREEWSVI